MADISKININSTNYNIKDTTARTASYYDVTLSSGSWTSSGSVYTQTATISGLRATHPPIITYSTNQAEYSYIDSGEASSGKIVFTASTKPTSDIALIVIDLG